MERITGMSKSLRVIHKKEALDENGSGLFRKYGEELQQHRPVQYVLGEAWFAGLRFYVDENVLIPRPETEELLDWVVADLGTPAASGFRILDIGTGSGCIPVSLGKRIPGIQLLACDIDGAALEVARKNSVENQVPVDFIQCDMLDESSWNQIPGINLIISNPPYIPEKQKALLDPHVRLFEPGLALFVPDGDPLLFYKMIGEFAKKKLLRGGKIFLEIHHDFSAQIFLWYRENGFIAELRKDLSGKNRMLRVQI
jgi:release factor glutamine methyltransferase